MWLKKVKNKALMGMFPVMIVLMLINLGSCISLAKTKIVFLDPCVPPYRLQVTREIFDQFEKENPGIEVEIQSTSSWSEQRTKLMTAIAGGGGPDVFSQDFTSFPTYAAKGIMENLDPYIAKDPTIDKSMFFDPLIEGCVIDGKTYGFPISAVVMVLFYNKDLFRRAGITALPETMEEFRSTGMTLKNLGDGIWGFAAFSKVKITVHEWMVDYLYPAGGSLMNEDYTEPRFNNDIGVEALQMAVDNVLKYKFQAPIGTEAPDIWVRGKTGMSTFWPFLVGYTEKYGSNINYACTGVPIGKAGRRISGGEFIAQGMLSTSKHKEEAWKLISFIQRDDIHFDFNKRRNHIPTKKVLLERDYYKTHPAWGVYLAQLPTLKLFPAAFPQFLDTAQILTEELENAYMGVKTPKQALDDAAKKVRKILKK